MSVSGTLPGSAISTILRHDAKVTSYKIAPLRAINDVVLAFPDVLMDDRPITSTRSGMADSWIGYYWPFTDPELPIRQGPQSLRTRGQTQDMAFRPALQNLRRAWQMATSVTPHPADGYVLTAELRTPRRSASYPPALHAAYGRARKVIASLVRVLVYRLSTRPSWRHVTIGAFGSIGSFVAWPHEARHQSTGSLASNCISSLLTKVSR